MRRCVHQLRVYTRALASLLPVQRFRIVDTSMQPCLHPGDRVLVWRWGRVRPGQLVVFRDPEAPSEYRIKRVAGMNRAGEVDVRGDNVNVSRDSRHFGPLPRRLVVGRAVFRYLPAQGRGRL